MYANLGNLLALIYLLTV